MGRPKSNFGGASEAARFEAPQRSVPYPRILIASFGRRLTNKLLPFVAVFVFVSFVLPSCATSAHEMTRSLVEGNTAALKGDYPTSVEKYEAALASVPESAAAKRNLGIVLVKVGNYQKAKIHLRESAKIYTTDAEVHYYLGEAYRGAEDFKRAIRSYQRALKLSPNELRVQKAIAWTWFKTGEDEKTLLLVSPLVQEHPQDSQIRLILASVQNRMKDFAAAQKTLAPVEASGFKVASKEKMSADSERALLMTGLADANYGLNQFAKAGQLYGEVIKMRPFYPAALVGSAKCDIRSSQSQRALTKLERALKADPKAAEALYLLAKLYEKIDSNKAIAHYQKFNAVAKDRPEFNDAVQLSVKALNDLKTSR